MSGECRSGGAEPVAASHGRLPAGTAVATDGHTGTSNAPACAPEKSCQLEAASGIAMERAIAAYRKTHTHGPLPNKLLGHILITVQLYSTGADQNSQLLPSLSHYVSWYGFG